MTDHRLRQAIIVEAARLMYFRHQTEYYRAKMKAAERLCKGWVKPSELPSNSEIRDEIQRMAKLYEGDARLDRLQEMRLEALRIMRVLSRFRPRIIGSTFTGHIRHGSDIDIHVFSTSTQPIEACLDDEGIPYSVERKQVRKHGEERTFTHIHVMGKFPVELTVYPLDKISFVFRSSITGKAIERATLPEYEQLMGSWYPDVDLDPETLEADAAMDRFMIYRSLLLPLGAMVQGKTFHPEGDVLTHLLQCYDLAVEQFPWDEEFQLAALLHDVGKGIDPDDHVRSGLEALEGTITPRTAWLIEHHMEAHQIHDRTIGYRAHQRLKASEDYETLLALGECDRAARVPGVPVPDVDDALEEIRELARTCGM